MPRVHAYVNVGTSAPWPNTWYVRIVHTMSDGWDDGSFDATSLSPANDPASFEVHLAAVEFALANAIIIRDPDDIQSARHWSERFKPFQHQVRNLITFCRRAPVALFADDVGLGKTISAGLVLSELMTRGKVGRALVVCPAILMHQWRAELRDKFGISSTYESGRAVLPHLGGSAPVIITTYHTASRYIDEVRHADFDMLILDEAHKLKSLFGQPRPARMAVRIHKALGDGVFKYALMLTATPIQNTAWDLYSLIDALAVARYHENPFGPPQAFETEYLMHEPGANRRGKPKYLRPDKREKFRTVLSEYMVRASRGTANLPFPERTVRLRRVSRGAAEEEMLASLKAHVDRLRGVEVLSLALAMMSSPAAFAHQMERMAVSRPWLQASATKARGIADGSPAGAKLATLLRIIGELRQERGSAFRAVVFTNRKETQRVLGEALAAHGVRVGFIRGAHAPENRRTIERFGHDPPDVNVVVSTDAGAEGVNLQVANVLVNYDLPWNPMTIEQRIGRVQRLGSNHASVVVVNTVVADTIEEHVVARLLAKLQTITNALGDVEAILEAASRGVEEEDSFENEVGHLVMQSLREQPIEDQLRKIEENIQSAKTEYEREQHVVEEALGNDLEAMHSMGPQMPRLEPVYPRMDVPTFVRAAFEADGAHVAELDDGRFLVAPRGRQTFVATFDSADSELRRPGRLTGVAGANVELYEVGSRPFERLVGSWAQRRLHLSHDASFATSEAIQSALVTWLEALGEGVDLVDHQLVGAQPKFHGTVSLRASVAVTHDRLERLIDVDVGDPVETAASGPTPLYTKSLEPNEIDGFTGGVLTEAVTDHADLGRFAAFYAGRRDEEVSKRSSAEQRIAIERNYTPRFAAELQGARGIVTEALDVNTSFTIDGEGPYDARVQLQGGLVVQAPPIQICAASGRSVPAHLLEPCAITGQMALPHTMIASEASGRRAIPAEARYCAITSRTLLRDEVEASAVSGVVAASDQFASCPVTKQRLLESELARCYFTGQLVSPAGLATSEVSGQQGRSDQMVASSVSGTVGHESEMSRCEITGAWALPDELAISDVSGRRTRVDQLVSVAKRPEMRGHPKELVRCSVSGKRLLERDTDVSVVSGARADRDLMVASEKSGRPALQDELLSCEESGALVLPEETAICAETRMRVDADLLVRNDFSNSKMLARLLYECPETGRRGRAADLVRCEATDTLVDPAVTTVCTQTEKRVLARLTVACAECAQPLYKDAAVRTYDHARAHPDHVGNCLWTGRTYLRRDLGMCALTGTSVAKAELGPNGWIAAFDALMHQRDSKGAPVDRSQLASLRKLFSPKELRPSRAWTLPAPNPDVLAVLFEVRRSLGLRRTVHAGFVTRDFRSVLAEAQVGS